MFGRSCRVGFVCAIALVAFGAGCAPRVLVPTPNLYLAGDDPYDEVPEALRNNRVEMLYVTDRRPEPQKGDAGETSYGYGRSMSVALGRCTVTIGEDVDWTTLVNQCEQERTMPLKLALSDVTELVRMPEARGPYQGADASEKNQAVEDARRVGGQEVAAILSERMAVTPRKEVYLFVHGFNNTFEVAAFRLAELWHFLGRQGVPIVYTWPAGHGGLLRGYNYDRESGEFTVYHLRQTIAFLARCPDVEKIHIIGHSRGTDVVLTALRELHIEHRAAGRDTQEALKLGNVILAAPDLDFEVLGQRIAADGVHLAPERLTIYLSLDDKAIGLSSWLFDSIRRLGKLSVNDLTDDQKARIGEDSPIQFVHVDVQSGWLGHGYFTSNPAVLSDLILVLRDSRAPGAEHGRPLKSEGHGFWSLTDDYLLTSHD